ncbi:MAG: hypothetical protein ACYCWE_02945 [Eubacteriales bacterium]
MKRILAIIMVLLIVFSLTACGSSSTGKSSTEGDNIPAEVSNTGKENKLMESETKDPEPNSDEITTEGDNIPAEVSNTSKENKLMESETKSDEITFEELVVVDNNECTIKITKIDPDNMWGYTLKVNLENKSVDKTYMFSLQNGAVNGVEYDPFFATEVTAGKKSNNDISFSNDDLNDNIIKEFTDIEMTFKVYDSNDWMADPVALETVNIYPLGEEKATTFVRDSQSTDTVLFDDENVSVIVMGYTNDSIWGYSVNMYVVNKTNKPLMYAVDGASVNGYMADPFWSKEIQPGKAAFTSMSWSDTTFEENDIKEVEEIEMLFRVYDSNDWMADKLIEETVTLNL